jgi:hypothetical protein
VNADETFEAAIRVTDMAGRTVSIQQGVSFLQGENTFTLDINSLANGFYLVSLESQNGRNVRKLSILR